MLQDLLIELFCKDNEVLTVPRKALLARVPGIPDPRFAHEMESGLVHNWLYRAVGVGSEKDGGGQRFAERLEPASGTGSALLHPEGVQHLGSAGRSDAARPLPVCQGCQEQWNEAILAPGQTVVGVPGDEEHELAIAAFVDQSSSWGASRVWSRI
jgi:hypothetical protein